MTEGFRPGHLVLLAGRPSMGKTSFALNIARNVAMGGGRAVGIFSLELTKNELTKRMLSAEAGVERWRLEKETLRPEDDLALDTARKTLAAAPLDIVDDASLTLAQVRTEAARMKDRHQDLGLIVLDYTQLLATSTTARSREQVVTDTWEELKALARELAVPMLVVSQLPRFKDGRADSRPRPSDVKMTEADLALLLYRDEVYEQNSPDRGIVEMTVVKDDATVGVCKLAFTSECMRFSNLKK